MMRLLPVSAVVALCLTLPATALSQSPPADPAAPLIASDLKTPDLYSAFIPDDPSIPAQMLDIMRISQLHYLEGSDLLKSGQSAKARVAFNVAVDTILKSDWVPLVLSAPRALLSTVQLPAGTRSGCAARSAAAWPAGGCVSGSG